MGVIKLSHVMCNIRSLDVFSLVTLVLVAVVAEYLQVSQRSWGKMGLRACHFRLVGYNHTVATAKLIANW